MVQSKSGLWEDQALAGSLSARLRHARPPFMSSILSAVDIQSTAPVEKCFVSKQLISQHREFLIELQESPPWRTRLGL